MLADICLEDALEKAKKCDKILNEVRVSDPEKLNELG